MDSLTALKAKPVGEGPSERIVSIAKAVQECAFAHESDARLIGNICAEDIADLCDAVIDRRARPAAPPAPEPGEVDSESIEAIGERVRRKYYRSGLSVPQNFTMTEGPRDA